MDFSELVGKILIGLEVGETSVLIKCLSESFELYHMQDCCEHVRIVETIGNPSRIIDAEVIAASEEVYRQESPPWLPKEKYDPYDSYTYSVYTICTTKGSVRITWLGESNGYYSESVYFGRTNT
jgi:hypothetical protein